MTITSFTALRGFLNKFQPFFFDDMRIADYGGTDAIGEDSVRQLLASGNLRNYHMLDFDNGHDLRKPIKGEKYDMGICMDLLEHTSNPFLVAKNIAASLKPGAYLFVTVPFVWPLHGFPDDYWRFSPSGVVELFKDMEMQYFETVPDSFVPTPKRVKEMKALPGFVSTPYSRIIAAFKAKPKKK
jgi:SAM-dependent methyltransferase